MTERDLSNCLDYNGMIKDARQHKGGYQWLMQTEND